MKCKAFECAEPCEKKCDAEEIKMCGYDFCKNHIMRGDRGMYMRNRVRKVIAIAFAVAMFLSVRTFVLSPAKVYGDSMEPTLQNGNVLWVQKYDTSAVKRFDIVIAIVDNKPYIKRVIGLPGEVVLIDNEQVYINGVPLEENYGLGETVAQNNAAVVLQNDEVYLLGDNREISEDSRYFGAVKLEQIAGIAVIRFFPFWDITMFRGE